MGRALRIIGFGVLGILGIRDLLIVGRDADRHMLIGGADEPDS
jgi:hypothetical protein